MKIRWLGHSCFLLTSEDGVRIVMDPFDPKVGYPVPAVEADIVTESHQHGDHNYTQELKGAFQVIDKPGQYTERGIDILGVAAFHDNAGGAQRGSNILFRVKVDGLTVVHCGDLGHKLTAEQVQALGPVDVLLIPVGGHFTIDAAAALEVIGQLKPSLTVPMHFKTDATGFPIAPVQDFLQAAGGTAGTGKLAGAEEIQVSRESLGRQKGIIVLDFPRGKP